MTRDEIIEKLMLLWLERDFEKAHGEADDLLIEYINDPLIKKAYDGIRKEYA